MAATSLRVPLVDLVSSFSTAYHVFRDTHLASHVLNRSRTAAWHPLSHGRSAARTSTKAHGLGGEGSHRCSGRCSFQESKEARLFLGCGPRIVAQQLVFGEFLGAKKPPLSLSKRPAAIIAKRFFAAPRKLGLPSTSGAGAGGSVESMAQAPAQLQAAWAPSSGHHPL